MMPERVIDTHCSGRVIHSLEGLVVALQLLERVQQPYRIARQLHATHVGERLPTTRKGQANQGAEDESDQRKKRRRGDKDDQQLVSSVVVALSDTSPESGPPQDARQEHG